MEHSSQAMPATHAECFFAELGGKDVEDLFTAVLSPAATQPAPLPQPPPPPQLMSLHSQGMFLFCVLLL